MRVLDQNVPHQNVLHQKNKGCLAALVRFRLRSMPGARLRAARLCAGRLALLAVGLVLAACAEPDAEPGTETASQRNAVSQAEPSRHADPANHQRSDDALSRGNAEPETGPGTGTGPRSAAAIVAQHCSVCHERGLYDAPRLGDAEAWRKRLLTEGRDHLWQVVLTGEKAMPPRGNCHDCSDEELRAAFDYLLAAADPPPP